MENEYLICGIDPGITTGYALLNLNGKLIKIHSSKKLNLNSLISEITKVGKPIIIACDVENPPLLVRKLAAKLKAKIICPNKDLTVEEKRKIVNEYNAKIGDSHQRDSLAAAIFAFNHFSKLFKKIDSHLRELGLEEKVSEVKKKLILGEAKSIKDALKKKPEKIMLQPKKRRAADGHESKIPMLKKEIQKLKEKMYKLEEENKQLKKKIEALSKVRTSEDWKKLAELREKTIDSLSKKLKELSKERELEVQKLKEVIKILKKKRWLLVSKKDIKELNQEDFSNVLFIESPRIPSEDDKKRLKELKISIIILGKKNKKVEEILRSDDFSVIDASKIKIKKMNEVFVVDKKEIEDALKINIISKIQELIDEYKRGRIKERSL